LIRFRRPSQGEIDTYLGLPQRPYNYPEVGSSATAAALESIDARYDVDRHHFPLGTGRDLFRRAEASMFAWRQFEIPWLELAGATKEVISGEVVATLTRFAGLWFLNPCRVVYVEASNGSAERRDIASFAYGTLAGHVDYGEERFSVRFNPETEEVAFEILAFSRPSIPLSRLGYFWVRRVQKRFALGAARAMTQACAEASQ
jgi:uncharacterized protein (UPF0548 family)